jgi:hypothetical protein
MDEQEPSNLEPWRELDDLDICWGVEHGRSLEETAMLLCRTREEVRKRMRDLGPAHNGTNWLTKRPIPLFKGDNPDCPARYLQEIKKEKRIISREYAKWPTITCRPRSFKIAWRAVIGGSSATTKMAGSRSWFFSGPNARERAIRYADHHYRDFEEVSLVPY